MRRTLTRLLICSLALCLLAACNPSHPKIAYSSVVDDNWEIYTLDLATHSTVNVSRNLDIDQDPQWSKDGKQILFTSNRDNNNELYLINADGTNLTRLTNNPGWDQDPCW